MSMPSRRRRGSTSTSTPSGADLVALAAHKAEGPKGTGALWIRRGTHILAQQHGGSQERYRRAGTENVAGAVGMATAFELRAAERATLVPKVRARRDRLLTALTAVDGVEATGHPVERLPHIASVDRPRHRRRLDHRGPRPRRDRGVDGLRVHQRLHRRQPRPDGDGLSRRRRRAAPSGSASAAPPPTRRSPRRRASCRRSSSGSVPRPRRPPRTPSPSPRARRRPRRSRSAERCPGSSSRCRVASTARSRRRCSTSRATRSSASGCASTTSPTRTPRSARAAARPTPPTTRDGSPRGSGSRSTS